MSSRLLTMKFMQRAAATSAPTSPASTADHKSKRQRLSDGSFRSPGQLTPSSDDIAAREALADEEAKRQLAIEREAAHRGETKWYLDVQPQASAQTTTPVKIVSAGYSVLDTTANQHQESENTEEAGNSRLTQSGRRTFGKPVVKQEEPKQQGDEHSISSESDYDPGGRTNSTHEQQRGSEDLRAKLKAKRKSDGDNGSHLAGERRNKQVKLNQPTSISSGGRSSSIVACHACGQAGHVKAQCTNVRRHPRKTL